MTTQSISTPTSPTPVSEPHWLNALPEPARERIFAAMRLLGDMAEKYRHEHQRLFDKNTLHVA